MTEAPISRSEAERRLAAAKQRLLYVECRDDFLKFCKSYLPSAFEKPFGKHQLEFIGMLQKNLKKGLRAAIAMPRGFGKTTILQAFTLWCILYKKKEFIAVICEESRKAVMWMDWVKSHLEGEGDDGPRIVEDFGDLVNHGTWGKENFVTSTGIRVIARGPKTSARGLKHRNKRPNLILVDDVEKDDLVRTIEQRDVLEQWFRKAILNTMPNDGDLVMVGTTIHYDSLLTRVLANKAFVTMKIRALDEDGNATWGEMWSKEALESKKEEIGSEAFASEYMNDPVNEENAPFKLAKVKALLYTADDLFVLGSQPPRLKFMYHFLTIDPAWSKGRHAHWCAMMICGVDPEGHLWIRDMFREHTDEFGFADAFFQFVDKWSCLRAGVESVFGQQGFKNYLELEMVKRQKVVELVDLIANVAQKEVRIRSTLLPRIEQRAIHIPANHRHTPVLIEELVTFPRGKSDDLIDSLAYVPQIAFTPQPDSERAKERRERILSIVDKTFGYVHTESIDESDEEDD